MKYLNPLLFISFFLFIGSFSGISQKYVLDNETSFLQVLGTSTLHDWNIQVQKQKGEISFSTQNPFEINALSFEVESESFDSGKKAMDKKTYKALNTGKFKLISFSYSKTISSKKVTDNTYNYTVMGNLTICGVTKPIEVKMNLTKNKDLIILDGGHSLKMSDYGIEPPKALLGTIKTGDEIQIKFKSIFTN